MPIDETSPAAVNTQLNDYFSKMELDPESTQATLGRPYKNVSHQSLLDATSRVLKLSRREIDPDDRDSMEFQTVHDASDFLPDKIRMDQNQVMKQQLWKVTGNPDKLQKIPPAVLNKHVEHLFNNSGLAFVLEEINPIENLDQNLRIHRMGEGALSSVDAIPVEARNVSPTYFGIIDPIRSPERMKVGVDLAFARTVRKGPDNLVYSRMTDIKTGKPVWVSSKDLPRSIIAFPGALAGKDKYVIAMVKGKGMEYVDRRTVNYELPSGDDMMNTLVDLIPMQSGVQGMRTLMGCLAPNTFLIIRRPLGFWFGQVKDYEWREGDHARSIDKNTGKPMWRPVRGVRRNDESMPCYRVSVQGADDLVTTFNHIWVTQYLGDTLAVDLRPGMLVPRDSLFATPEEYFDLAYDIAQPESEVVWVPITAVEAVANIQGTYDLDLDDNVFMCGSGIFVHNSKFSKSALPLVHREAPLVQSTAEDGTPSAQYLGRFAGAQYTKDDGVVQTVGPDMITVKTADGVIKHDLYNEYPYARKTYIHNDAVVKPGDKVKAGDLLAASNFTDKSGQLAVGTNLRVAYTPADGMTHEDSVVISESAAKKLTAVNMYHEDLDLADDLTLSKARFMQTFPGKFTAAQLAKIQDNGVIKPGVTINPGDPVYLGVTDLPKGPGNMGRGGVRQYVQTWDYDVPGLVTDAVKTKGGYSTYMKTENVAQVGDKVAIPFGGKGVVSLIQPDSDMPTDAKGRPMEMLLTPLGSYSRTNPSQIMSAALGKVAAETGKPFIVSGYSDRSFIDKANEELAKAHMTFREDLFDPAKKVMIPQVGTGVLYTYKLVQTAESKGHSRGIGGYTVDGEPSRGSGESAKHYGDMEYQALHSHGVPAVIRDIKMKSQRNDDFWRQVKLGQTPAMPGTPFVYDKFKALLTAGGVNLTEDRNKAHIFAMTDKQVETLTGNRKLTTAETYGANTFKPSPGGLFDEKMTGSLGAGRTWSYFELPEPVLNPVMEEPIRSMLGVTKKDFAEIVSGNQPLNGKTGGVAIKEYLTKLNLDNVMKSAMETIQKGSKSKRDAAVKLYGYASAMKKEGVRPEDFMLTRVPVLPPVFRPISKVGPMTMVADPNYLYRALKDSIKDFQDAAQLPQEFQNQARASVYNNFKILTGVTDPDQAKLIQKNVGGMLQLVLGKGSPKTSFVNRRVIGGNLDLTGLGVLTLNPALKMNQIGLPEKQAWTLYEPFIIRKLVQQGMPAMAAAKAVEGHTPQARKAMNAAVQERPVLLNRAPTLHKYSIVAMEPVVVPGHAIQVPPAIIKTIGGDFDGDQCINQVIAFLSDDAILDLVKQYGVAFKEAHMFKGDLKIPTSYRGSTFLFDLADFPHCDGGKTTQGAKGPIEWCDISPGICVLAYDEKQKKLCWAEATVWSKHFDREVEIVTLQSGKQTITDDDPRAVYGISSDSVSFQRFTPSESVAKHVMVPVQRTVPTLTGTVLTFCHRVDVGRKSSVTVLENIPLNFKTGYVFGSICGDGWVSVTNGKCAGQFHITNNDLDVLDTVSQYLGDFFVEGRGPDYSDREMLPQPDAAYEGRYGSSVKRSFCSMQFSRILHSLLGHTAQQKHLPAFFLGASEEFRKGLFAGLMDTDGSLSVSNAKNKPQLLVNFCTTSIRLANEIRLLSLSLGINARLSASTYRETRKAWTVSFSALPFVKTIVPLMKCKRRTDKALNIEVTDRSSAFNRTDKVPFKVEWGRILTAPVGAAVKANQMKSGLYSLVSNIKCGKVVGMSRLMAEEVIKTWSSYIKDDPEYALWKELVESKDVSWDPVVSYEKTGIRETGYDLTVPGYETFVAADGIVLSNTVSYSVPYSAEAIKEAREKMSPTANLLSVANDQPNYAPSQEFVMGGYFMSKPPAKADPVRFQTWDQAKAAYRAGQIRVDTPVVIGR